MKAIMKLIVSVMTFLFLSAIVLAGEKVYFYHNDPSGTPIAMSDQSGNIVWRADYKPFGEEQTVTGTIQNKKEFVGKEKDIETGLDYFGARYHKDKIGRFISPDPVGAVNPWNCKTNYELLLNPQRLNLYAYGLNNPYRYLDPNGKWPEEIHNKIIGEAFSGGKYKNVRIIFKKASAYVDEFQEPQYSYMHAMRGLKQNAEEAERKMNRFIMYKVKEYEKLMSQGKTDEAYFALGEAMHPLMDSTSPTHERFQEWKGLKSPIKSGYHIARESELFFGRDDLTRSVNQLKTFYDTFK